MSVEPIKIRLTDIFEDITRLSKKASVILYLTSAYLLFT